MDLIWLSRVQKSVSLEVGQTINFMAGTTEHSKPFHKARQLNLIKQLFWQVAESGKSAIKNVSRHKFDECMNVFLQVKMCFGRVRWQLYVRRVEGVPPESFMHVSDNSFLGFLMDRRIWWASIYRLSESQRKISINCHWDNVLTNLLNSELKYLKIKVGLGR